MRFVSALLEQLFPEACIHCERRIAENGLLCGLCRQGLRPVEGEFFMPGGQARHHALYYEAAAKSLFAAAKFSNRRRAQQQLQRWTELSLQKLNNPESTFVEMPSSRAFLHNLLKRSLPQEKIVRGLFLFAQSQKGSQNKLLKEAERFQRIAETLKLSEQPIPAAKTYVLCDDVYTTGATLGHAAWLLQQKFGLKPEQIKLWTLMYRQRMFEDEAN